MKKKFITFIIMLLLICSGQVGLASEEYPIPDNFGSLMDKAYDAVYRKLEISDTLLYDFYIFDENCLGLSTISRAIGTQLSLSQMRDYHHKSLERYQPDNNFILMVMAYDLENSTNVKEIDTQIAFRNSEGQFMKGSIIEDESYDQLALISFPRKKLEQFIGNDDLITIQFTDRDNNKHNIFYNRYYVDEIPQQIRELIDLVEEDIK